MALTVTEKWICERVNLQHDNLDDIKSLSLPGSYHEKIVHLGNSLKGFTRLKNLDLSRNDISVLDGLDHLRLLETLNLYYNSITSLKELFKLRHNKNLKEIDIRLNPVTKNEPDYRLFLIHMIPTLKMLDDRSVRDTERKAAVAHFNTDQASQFDESPPRLKQKNESERVQKPSRSDMIRKFASRHSALDDDDVALIDLVSMADIGRENTEKSSYYAETYDKNELKRIPSPYAEKYSTRQDVDSTSGNKGKHYHEKEETTKEPSSYDGGVELHYERQPFVSNGYFTPNPANESHRHSGHYEKVARTEQSSNERSGISNDPVQLSGRTLSRTKELHTPARTEMYTSMDAEAKALQYFHRNSKIENGDENAIGKRSFISPADFRGHELDMEAKTSHSMKIKTGAKRVDDDQHHDLLRHLLLLVDKYWNGSGSLQMNEKFKKIAGELISRELISKSKKPPSGSSLELESRDKELSDLHAQMKDVQTENDRLKKRLQNEEEIQRTIELTDQDLKRLQSRIEEVQAENKTLKSKCSESEAERKFIDRLRNESDESKRSVDVLQRENRTLSQQCEQQSTTLSQLQELTAMLQESHRSLVVTNDHLLQELDDTRQRHQQEVQQLHWSYEQLKKTSEWLPRATK